MYAVAHSDQSGWLTTFAPELVAGRMQSGTSYRLAMFAMQHVGIGVQRSFVECCN